MELLSVLGLGSIDFRMRSGSIGDGGGHSIGGSAEKPLGFSGGKGRRLLSFLSRRLGEGSHGCGRKQRRGAGCKSRKDPAGLERRGLV